MRKLAPWLLLLMSALPLAAQMQQNFERGFAPEKAYNFGSIDHVGLFNGNLVVTIPIGGSFSLGGGTSYALTLTYNSNLWNYLDVHPTVTYPRQYWEGWAYPTTQANAGVGWLLSLGKMVDDDPENPIGKFGYMSPDGNEHEVAAASIGNFVDSSFMRWSSTLQRLDSPDGVKRTFYMATALKEQNRFGWLQEMDDAYGNWVKVTQTATTGTDGLLMLSQWKIEDSSGRTHYVNFKRFYGVNTQGITSLRNYQTVVDSVDLQTAGGRAVYNFRYADDAGTTDAATVVNNSCRSEAEGWPTSFTLPFLRKVTLPDGSTYEPAYNTPGVCSALADNGVMESLTLPTKGSIAWNYGTYTFPKVHCDDNAWIYGVYGVTSRTLKDRSGASLGTTTYTPSLSNSTSVNCGDPTEPRARITYQQMTNTVVSPNGRKDVNHFTTVLQDDNSTLDWRDYGLPLTRLTKDGDGRGLSVEYDCSTTCSASGRKKYLDYVFDDAYDPINPQIKSEHTVFEDGNSSTTDNSDKDQYGHFLTSTTKTFGAPDRTTYVHYTPDTANWILNKYDYQTVVEGTHGSKTEACFDSRGFLTRRRTLKGDSATPENIAESSDDLLAIFADDGSGNVTSEKYYGGDGASLATTALCGLTPPAAPSYEIAHTYVHDVLATTKYMNGTTSVLQTANRMVDANTAVTAESDASGLSTSYSYKSWGAYDQVQPPGQTATTFSYYVAGASTPAETTISQNDQSVTYVFDDLGRPTVEKRRLPDVSGLAQYSIRETTYDAAGRKSTVSEFELLPDGSDETSFHPAHKTTYTYDTFDRPVTVTAPDGSVTTFSYTGASSMTRTVKMKISSGAPSDVAMTENYDGRGRISSVVEKSGATSASATTGADVTTTYAYDLGNHLSSVSMPDGSTTQTRSFVYDNRGFLLSETHPELGGVDGNGTIAYSNYDARGHALKRTTGSDSAFDLNFTYDKAERLTNVKDSAGKSLKTFVFATANATDNYRNGRLQSAVRDNRVTGTDIRVTEDYEYGSDANVSKRTTKVENVNEPANSSTTIQTFSQTFAYDVSGNLTSIHYPTVDGTISGTPTITELTNRYASGFLVAVPDYSGSSTADGIAYHPGGMVKSVDHGHSVIDSYDIESTTLMNRPSKITFGGYRTCTPPAAPTITPSSTTTCPGASNSATASTATSYQWTIQNGAITGGTTSSTVTFTAGTSGTVTLTLTVTNSCGSSATASRSVTINPLPLVTVSNVSGSNTQVQATLTTGTAPWSITWSDNVQQNGNTQLTVTRAAGPGRYTVTNVTDANCAGTSTGSAAITPAVPAGVVASATSSSQVSVTWSIVSGAATYEILRSNTAVPGMNLNNYVVAGTAAAPPFIDSGRPANTAYLYRVRAVTSDGVKSDGSNYDLATTTAFSSITAQVTKVQVLHFTEMRNAVNAVRALAGLAPGSYSSDLLLNNVIRAVHLTELRTALDQARAALQLPAVSYGETITPQVTTIKKVHVDELRGGVQ